jgi:hypothetical protein
MSIHYSIYILFTKSHFVPLSERPTYGINDMAFQGELLWVSDAILKLKERLDRVPGVSTSAPSLTHLWPQLLQPPKPSRTSSTT